MCQGARAPSPAHVAARIEEFFILPGVRMRALKDAPSFFWPGTSAPGSTARVLFSAGGVFKAETSFLRRYELRSGLRYRAKGSLWRATTFCLWFVLIGNAFGVIGVLSAIYSRLGLLLPDRIIFKDSASVYFTTFPEDTFSPACLHCLRNSFSSTCASISR